MTRELSIVPIRPSGLEIPNAKISITDQKLFLQTLANFFESNNFMAWIVLIKEDDKQVLFLKRGARVHGPDGRETTIDGILSFKPQIISPLLF